MNGARIILFRLGRPAGPALPACAKNMTAPKLRMLCLHGYTQSGEVFRDRTGSTRKALKSAVDFVFPDAPHKATNVLNDADGNPLPPTGLAWWNSGDISPLLFQLIAWHCTGEGGGGVRPVQSVRDG